MYVNQVNETSKSEDVLGFDGFLKDSDQLAAFKSYALSGLSFGV